MIEQLSMIPMMRICHEREHYRAPTGEDAGYNHCGSSREIDGVDYCAIDGNMARRGYSGMCGGLKRAGDD